MLLLKTYTGPRRKLIRCAATKNVHRSPDTIPPSKWNQREAVFEGIARTTNSVEEWRFGIQLHFTGSYPTIWKLLAAFKKDAASQKLRYLQTIAGQPELLRKKYRVTSTKKKRDHGSLIHLPFSRSTAVLAV